MMLCLYYNRGCFFHGFSFFMSLLLDDSEGVMFQSVPLSSSSIHLFIHLFV